MLPVCNHWVMCLSPTTLQTINRQGRYSSGLERTDTLNLGTPPTAAPSPDKILFVQSLHESSIAPGFAPPVVPPRPSKSPSMEAQQATEAPTVPARPAKKSLVQPRPSSSDRFAQSPLHSGFQPKGQRPTSSSSSHDQSSSLNEPIDRPASVSLPSLGEEGLEYGVLDTQAETELGSSHQTRTVGDNLKLHAPKPSLPPGSAKQQIMAVTRTDSDKAASLGLGKSSNGSDRPPSRDPMIRRPSSTLSTHSDHGNYIDDEHGIPKIGQRVPMNSHLGDVQAPSPAPEEGKRHHTRKHSARNMPPGSYGLHGHGVDPQDRLEKAYHEKHPELAGKAKKHNIHDHRQSDYAMSSNDLNRMVRDTARRRPTSSLYNEAISTPTEDVAFHASDEYAFRISTPQDSSHAEKGSTYFSEVGSSSKATDDERSSVLHAIHVDDSKHPEHYSYGTENPEAENYHAPILADDEIEADANVTARNPAIRPGFDRSRSYDADEPKIPSIRHTTHDEDTDRGFNSTPLDDVEEYEPLFDEEKTQEEKKQAAAAKRAKRQFPSKDIWEDAPSSVHYSTEVSTPDVEEQNQRPKSKASFSENRSITPAQAFAQYQEELAEKEAGGRSNKYLPLSADTKPKWIDHQSHLGVSKASSSRRFPSKDIWEDAPESHIHEATLSESAVEDESKSDDSKPDVPARPAKKVAEESQAPPAIPSRPKPVQAGDDATKQPPSVSEKPKPHIPARPVKKLSGDSKDREAVKPPKPPVPSRPAGGKIAALQAGFMSDLNKRLQLGPQALKKEEPEQQEEVVEKEKAPLSDARKSRARGPQRRAPATAASPVKEPSALVLCLSRPQTLFSIDSADRLVVTEESREIATELSKTTHEPVEDLAKSSGHEAGKEANSPPIKEASKDLEPSIYKEPSHDATKTVSVLADDDVTDQTKTVEPAAVAKDGLVPDLVEKPVTAEPAIEAVDKASTDIVNAKLPSSEVEEKSALKVQDLDAAHDSAAKEQDIGDVPLTHAQAEEDV
ncbi:hypothetical protein CCM_04682 [Cordyceps militaris CM01]|uniref:Altered inheritance of mitochondria protein 21 n=1 Tax=Cordyceps militaris (strain CM01) TaxID=983644 RepID=G3JGP0_CORMM|nr:uncharacterized protein CCM_04682 [Cordyceps militaris CM01]EGX93309.1 hypothetical protein CCM_04682 [Cordyceps militaris CM01]